MQDLYILASIPDQGKTTTAILLEKKLRDKGQRVACLQMNKDKKDVYRYLSEGCYHYTVPFEAAQSREAFNQWVPIGYDSYILELSYSFSPVGAVYISLFNSINELISYEYRENWKQHAEDRFRSNWTSHHGEQPYPPDLMSLWDDIHGRNIRQVITKTPEKIGLSVDQEMILHGSEYLAVEKILPKMTLPQGKKKVIAVGVFPGEYWDIFPGLRWFDMDYAGFMDFVRKESCDLIIIGGCGEDRLKLQKYPGSISTICYQPSVFLDLQSRKITKPLITDIRSIYETIKMKPPGTPLTPEGEPFSGYNNPYWVYRLYDRSEVVWREDKIVFCNGWVLPQYLIRDGYLEVN